jgi:hypothetical protein
MSAWNHAISWAHLSSHRYYSAVRSAIERLCGIWHPYPCWSVFIRGPGSVVRDPWSGIRGPGSVVRDPCWSVFIRGPGSVSIRVHPWSVLQCAPAAIKDSPQ